MSKGSFLTPMLLVLLIIAGQVIAKPELTINPAEFDFGYAPYNTRISHSFWIHSTGDETVNIEKVITGCGCTKAPLTKHVIPPGDSAKLEIIFNTNKYKNKVVKSPKILSNAPEKSVTIITNVLKEPDLSIPLVSEPAIIDFSESKIFNSKSIDFKLNNISKETLKISLVDYPNELFEIKLPEKINAGYTAKGSLKLKSIENIDQFQKSFTIELNDQNKTRLTIPIVKNRPSKLSMMKK